MIYGGNSLLLWPSGVEPLRDRIPCRKNKGSKLQISKPSLLKNCKGSLDETTWTLLSKGSDWVPLAKKYQQMVFRCYIQMTPNLNNRFLNNRNLHFWQQDWQRKWAEMNPWELPKFWRWRFFSLFTAKSITDMMVHAKLIFRDDFADLFLDFLYATCRKNGNIYRMLHNS